jgi:DnaJ-class molecular chaperone
MTNSTPDITEMDYVKTCPFCAGKGSYRQTYTVGCGMGCFQMMGRCDDCEGTGYLSTLTGKALPTSVLRQIEVRAKKDRT